MYDVSSVGPRGWRTANLGIVCPFIIITTILTLHKQSLENWIKGEITEMSREMPFSLIKYPYSVRKQRNEISGNWNYVEKIHNLTLNMEN